MKLNELIRLRGIIQTLHSLQIVQHSQILKLSDENIKTHDNIMY